MALYGIRFDLRNPSFANTPMSERINAAIDMTEWADRHGFVVAVLSEHHGCEDGYLPSPLALASAIAARTTDIRIQIAALVAPLHDPLRLAEDAAIVDLISRGRLDLVLTNGYVASEFAMFGRELSERPARTTEAVETLRQAWTGEPFEFRGRRARVTPRPQQDPGPPIWLGGSTPPAARRAARIADGFLPSSPELWDVYRKECVVLGKPDPGEHMGGDTSMFHLATDVEAGWAAIVPHAMHEVNAYGQWMVEAGLVGVGGYEPVSDPDVLRASGQYRVITPAELVAEIKAKGPFGFSLFHPLMGGIPPELGWESLRLFETEVLPHVQGD